MMVELDWMPFIFWFSVCLTLIPAGIAISSANLKNTICLVMIAEFGVFLLMISLKCIWPAYIYLIVVLLLNTLVLYGNNIFPSQDDHEPKQSRRSLILKAGLSALIFIMLIAAFYHNFPKAVSGISLQSIVPDISLLLILTGLIFILIFIAVRDFFKRK